MKKVLWSVFISAMVSLPQARATQPLVLKESLPLPGVTGRLGHLAVDVKGQRLFVAAPENGTVEVLDLKDPRRQDPKRHRSIKDCLGAQGLLFLPRPNLLFVTCTKEGRLKTINCDSYAIIKTLGSLPQADALRYDEPAARVYVGYNWGALAVINSVSGVQTYSIELHGRPAAFELQRYGDKIFVNVPDRGQVSVVNRLSRSVETNWSLGKLQDNTAMALDETNSRLFVACRKPPRLAVLDAKEGKILAEAAISEDAGDLFYDAKRKRLYVSCGEGFVDVLGERDANGYDTLEKVATARGAQTSLFAPELDLLFVAVPQRGNQPAEIRLFNVCP